MKCVIRPNIWESNSSMSHSCIILPKYLSEKWKNNDDAYHYHGEILTSEELKKRLVEDERIDINEADDEDAWQEIIDELKWDEIFTYQGWTDVFYDECDETEYVTEHGDEIVIHCKYGAHY